MYVQPSMTQILLFVPGPWKSHINSSEMLVTIHSFTHSVNECLLSTYYIPGTLGYLLHDAQNKKLQLKKQLIQNSGSQTF